jgi:hypothetical protein
MLVEHASLFAEEWTEISLGFEYVNVEIEMGLLDMWGEGLNAVFHVALGAIDCAFATSFLSYPLCQSFDISIGCRETIEIGCSFRFNVEVWNRSVVKSGFGLDLRLSGIWYLKPLKPSPQCLAKCAIRFLGILIDNICSLEYASSPFWIHV